jgi:hypothetical protein
VHCQKHCMSSAIHLTYIRTLMATVTKTDHQVHTATLLIDREHATTHTYTPFDQKTTTCFLGQPSYQKQETGGEGDGRLIRTGTTLRAAKSTGLKAPLELRCLTGTISAHRGASATGSASSVGLRAARGALTLPSSFRCCTLQSNT